MLISTLDYGFVGVLGKFGRKGKFFWEPEDSFLKSSFRIFPSDYTTSNRNHQTWQKILASLGGKISLDYPFPKEYFLADCYPS